MARRLHSSGLVELLESLGDARLVRDRDHAYPSSRQAQGIDGIEAWRASRDLHDCKGSPLGRAHSVQVERQIVDLCLYEAGDLAVPLWTAPHHAFGPNRMLAQFMDGGVSTPE